MSQLSPLLDYEAAAEKLGDKVRHVQDLVYKREIPFVKIGGKVRFIPEDLDSYIIAQRTPAQ